MEDHKTMVLLGVQDEKELESWEQKLEGMEFRTFVEPDIGNQKTAIAISPSVNPDLFKDMKLI